MVQLANILGFKAQIEDNPQEETGISEAEIEALIAQRTAARKAKNYAEGDRLRDLLQSQGITLIDQPGGVTKWHRN